MEDLQTKKMIDEYENIDYKISEKRDIIEQLLRVQEMARFIDSVRIPLEMALTKLSLSKQNNPHNPLNKSKEDNVHIPTIKNNLSNKKQKDNPVKSRQVAEPDHNPDS